LETDFDAIIFHYTALSARWDPYLWKKHYFTELSKLRKLTCPKVALPQDEYAHSVDLCRLFKAAGIETVFTCAQPCDYQTLYPSHLSGLKHYFSTYPGFVDENTFARLQQLSSPEIPRDIDIGYRARDVPYWLGRHGTIKGGLGDKIQTAAAGSNLHIDTSCDPSDVFLGDDWWKFLLRCRTAPGCLGGASLHDPEGNHRETVDKYTRMNPSATFDEVEQACFPGQDYGISLFALSPRHFECAMAGVCQLLYEGDYQGVFEPGTHCIEVKKDYSNLDDVIEQVKDPNHTKRIANNALERIINSPQYTYKNFAQTVVSHLESLISQERPVNSKLDKTKQILTTRELKELQIQKWYQRWHLFRFRIPAKIRKEWNFLTNR
jgi:hypothetical protein